MSGSLRLHSLAFKRQQDLSFLTTPGQLTPLQSSTELAQDFVQGQESRWAALCAASSAVKTNPETHPLSHKTSLRLSCTKEVERRGWDGNYCQWITSHPHELSFSGRWGEEQSTHTAHPTPPLSCLLCWWRRQLNLFPQIWKKKEARQRQECGSYFHIWARCSHQKKNQTLCLLSSLPPLFL